MTRLLWAIVLIAVLLAVAPAVFAAEASTELSRLFKDDWEFRLKQNPTFATTYGDRRYNDKLPVVSVSASEFRNSQDKKFLARLQKIDREALSAQDRLNYDIFRLLKENSIREHEFGTYLMPITNRSGFHVSFPQLPDRIPFKTVKDYENYVARLRAFARYAADHVGLMREGIRRGYVLPAIVLEGIEGSIEPHIVEDPQKSLLYKPFEDFPDAFSDRDRERLRKAGKKVIERSVVGAYKEFLTFLTYEYIPAARDDIGASSLPDGRRFYEHRVRYYTTLDLSPEEVHRMGLAEVERIRAEMDEIIRRVEFEGSFDDFVAFLRSDDRFYVDQPEELMMHVSLVLKKMDGELPRLFKTLPRMPYGIKPVPDYIAPKTTTAYYNRPAGDGTRAGFYYVNTYDLKSRPLYEVEALSLHEAVPGHHLQIAVQQELTGIPEFRRFSGFTAFVEGWALYAERLGLEAGFYDDPYSDFGRLTYEMWRACRLVVDTGMHYLDWTRREAIDFMAANTALTLHNITTEVDRYISWPGQALAYKIGELKIRELRALCETKLGSRFDVREFHDVVLGSGAVPLEVLESNVKSWLEVQLATN
ncbi:MAG: DUF885 family protein [Candidatus Krumholzibacteriia bacterium]